MFRPIELYDKPMPFAAKIRPIAAADAWDQLPGDDSRIDSLPRESARAMLVAQTLNANNRFDALRPLQSIRIGQMARIFVTCPCSSQFLAFLRIKIPPIKNVWEYPRTATNSACASGKATTPFSWRVDEMDVVRIQVPPNTFVASPCDATAAS